MFKTPSRVFRPPTGSHLILDQSCLAGRHASGIITRLATCDHLSQLSTPALRRVSSAPIRPVSSATHRGIGSGYARDL